MELQAQWIRPAADVGDAAPVYRKFFSAAKPVASAVLRVTALGVYEAQLNGQRVGEFFMAPGFTAYRSRLQVQEYDVTALLEGDNELTVTVGRGWYHTRFLKIFEVPRWRQDLIDAPLAAIAELRLTYRDGTEEIIGTGEDWDWAQSPVRFSDVYNGEVYDATYAPWYSAAALYEGPTHTLIAQEGPEVRAQERIVPAAILRTPKGETVIDFGQNLAGVVAVTVCAKAGETVDLSFGEVLDKDGNFYNANYRDARCLYRYTCRDGEQTYMPQLTFYGFRYVRVNEFPGGTGAVKEDNFTAIAIHSDMKRTGWLQCSEPLLNRLFENVVWGQKSNFLDIPTDCPQRDERMGWTGDAQMFARTACLNYDAEKFFTKWMADLRADQRQDGMVPPVIPDVRDRSFASPAWGDAATVVPWQVYLAYGDRELLGKQYESMCKWVDYITSVTTEPYLWIDVLPEGKRHYGDWLGLDAPYGTYKGASRDAFLGSAFYAYSTELVIKAGRALGKDVAAHEALYANILKAFQKKFPTLHTQTECALAAHFRLTAEPQKAADQLAEMVRAAGVQLTTGFIGTPYLLHALSDYGYGELAWSLLLRREYPSWLYPVTMGATTVWEHWDGIRPDGKMWSTDMNSYNHYAYGSVADWVYTKAAGIQTVEDHPGYERLRIAPLPDGRLDWLKATVNTRRGTVASLWRREGAQWRYEITTPVAAEIVIAGKSRAVSPGSYVLFSDAK